MKALAIIDYTTPAVVQIYIQEYYNYVLYKTTIKTRAHSYNYIIMFYIQLLLRQGLTVIIILCFIYNYGKGLLLHYVLYNYY